MANSLAIPGSREDLTPDQFATWSQVHTQNCETIMRLRMEISDLRSMIERLIAEAYRPEGCLSVTVQQASELFNRTGKK